MGDPGTDALLGAGFAATPFCLDYFQSVRDTPHRHHDAGGTRR